jgi:hypothetical protein
VLEQLEVVIGQQRLEFTVVQIRRSRVIWRLFPPDLDRAELLQQRVLDPGVKIGVAVVLLVPDPVDVVGGLRRGGLFLGLGRVEGDDLVAGAEIFIRLGIIESTASATSRLTTLEWPGRSSPNGSPR